MKNYIADNQEEAKAREIMEEILEVRKVFRMERWNQIIRNCQQSGLSNKAYCQQQEISEKIYYYWLQKL